MSRRVVEAGAEPARWTRVAEEGEILVLPLPVDLRYGGGVGEGSWLYKPGCVGELPVTNASFGVGAFALGVGAFGALFGSSDPAVGVRKHCEVAWRWERIAEEGDRITLRSSTPRTLRFGTPPVAGGLFGVGGVQGGWVERAGVVGDVDVEVAFFGSDPHHGVKKALELAVPAPSVQVLGVPTPQPPGDCTLCGETGVPVLSPCGAPAHAHCLPCALQALRAELEQRGGAVDLTYPVLCAVCKPSAYPAPARAGAAGPLQGWWLPQAVQAVAAWSAAASEAQRQGHHALRQAEHAVFWGRLVGALARAPPEAEQRRYRALGLRDTVMVCPNPACHCASLVERHESETDVVGGHAAAPAAAAGSGSSAAADEAAAVPSAAAAGGGAGAVAAAATAVVAAAAAPPAPQAPAPLAQARRLGHPAACPYCDTKACLDCGEFWALTAPGLIVVPVAGVNYASHKFRSCAEYAVHIAALPPGSVGRVGGGATRLAEATGTLASLFSSPQPSPTAQGSSAAAEEPALPPDAAEGVKYCPGCGLPGVHPRCDCHTIGLAPLAWHSTRRLAHPSPTPHSRAYSLLTKLHAKNSP